MKFLSPLRYPGGKACLATRFAQIIETNNLGKPIYVEPYAGGAGAALELLFSDKVKKIVINDLDYSIYCFWLAVVNDTSKFIREILSVPLTVEEWKKQKNIYDNPRSNRFRRGFAAFYLNRTNIFGVLNANPIGGINQTGKYKIDARFNRENLAERVRRIGEYRNKIVVTNDEAKNIFSRYSKIKDTFIYLDPPYFDEGSALYMNSCNDAYHVDLANKLNNASTIRWILTYDEKWKVRSLYKARKRKRLSFRYRTSRIRNARELMVFSDALSSK